MGLTTESTFFFFSPLRLLLTPKLDNVFRSVFVVGVGVVRRNRAPLRPRRVWLRPFRKSGAVFCGRTCGRKKRKFSVFFFYAKPQKCFFIWSALQEWRKSGGEGKTCAETLFSTAFYASFAYIFALSRPALPPRLSGGPTLFATGPRWRWPRVHKKQRRGKKKLENMEIKNVRVKKRTFLFVFCF